MEKIYKLLREDYSNGKIEKEDYLVALKRLVSNFREFNVKPWYCDLIKEQIQNRINEIK